MARVFHGLRASVAAGAGAGCSTIRSVLQQSKSAQPAIDLHALLAKEGRDLAHVACVRGIHQAQLRVAGRSIARDLQQGGGNARRWSCP